MRTRFLRYKSWYCDCGKEIRYLSQKQLDFLRTIHSSSRKHERIVGWTFPTLQTNEEFERSLREVLS